MSRAVRVIGCGSIGRRHLANLLAHGGVEVSAYDTDPVARARVLVDFPAVSVATSVMDETCHAVIIATPWDDHQDCVEAAIARGLPFLVEKPLSTIGSLPRLRELAARPGLPPHHVGYMLRYHPAADMLRAARAVAGVMEVRTDMRTWPGQAYGPGLLECSHELDLALWCGAPPVVTHVDVLAYGVRVTLGEAWEVNMEWRASPDDRRWQRRWSVSLNGDGGLLSIRRGSETFDGAYRAELAHFLARAWTEPYGTALDPRVCSLAEGVRVLDVCQQVDTWGPS